MNIELYTDDFQQYLKCDDVIDYDAPIVSKLADTLYNASDSEIDFIQKAYEYVRDKIPHSADIGENEMTCCASEVLKVGHGIKDVLDLLRRKQVLDILGDARGNAAPFSKTLPYLGAVLCRLFLFQQKMKLINVIASDLLFLTVCGNSVPHGILNDQHTDLFELVAKLLNIEADNTIAHINVGAMIKEVLAAVYEHFKGIGHPQSDFTLVFQLTL